MCPIWNGATENTMSITEIEVKRCRNQCLIIGKVKKILQYDRDGNFVREYPSMHEAARQLGKESVHGEQNISICARGKTEKAYGYVWKFADNNDVNTI